METWGSKVKKALSRLGKVNNYLYNKPEQDWTHEDKAQVISFLRKAKVAETMKDLEKIQEFFSNPLPEQTQEDPTDIIAMDVPLFIRMLEWAREDAETDMDLHNATERAIEAVKLRGLLSMGDYTDIIGEPIEEETGYSKYLATPENPQGKTPGLTPDIMGKILMKIATMGDDDVEETIRLGEGVIYEELCPKGKAYIKKRMAAGEKSSAYLSGRAVKVCKGQMKG
jgi:uncharacterized protein YktA (UPF0223 family)